MDLILGGKIKGTILICLIFWLSKKCGYSHHTSTEIQAMLCPENEYCYGLWAALKKKQHKNKNKTLMKDQNKRCVTLGTYVTIRS